jgi:tetratricopeptide (TPR) repeat protein
LTGARLSLAYLLGLQGHHHEAANEYRTVLDEDDGIPAAWSGLGMAQAAGDRLTKAEHSFRRSLELSRHGDGEALRGLAEVLQRTKREEEALTLLENAAAQGARGDLRQALAHAHYLLGIRLLHEDRQEKFLSEMRRAVTLDPLHGPAQYNLALDAVIRGEMEVAREHTKASLQAGYEFPPGFLDAVGLAEPTRTEDR